MIQATDIKKTFNKVHALRDISFEVRPKEIFGFIGPDGAGKTTLFRIISTLLLPDMGSIHINDLDVVKEYKKVMKISGYYS